MALVELTRLVLPGMIERKRGAVINVSSTAGFQPMPYAAIYAATKAFVTSFSMALAEEVRSDGITVVTLCPGPTQTESTSPGKSPSRLPGGRQPAQEVVEEALKKLERSGGLVVPRAINKIMAFSNRLMPLHVSAKIVARAMGSQDS
jgi:short-subunit dehydrogenase